MAKPRQAPHSPPTTWVSWDTLSRSCLLYTSIAGISYVVAGALAYFGLPGIIALPVGIVLMLGFLFFVKNARRSA